MKVIGTTQVNAPLEKTFEVFSDVTKAQERIPSITKVEIIEGPTREGVGTKWKETRTMFGQEASEIMWISAYEPNTTYTVSAESHGTRYTTIFKFTPNDNGTTTVDMTFEGIPVSTAAKMLSMLAFLMKGATQKALQDDLEALKKAAETNN